MDSDRGTTSVHGTAAASAGKTQRDNGRWQPVADALEPTAVAEKYIVYTRIGDGDFDNGVLVDGNSYRTTLPADVYKRQAPLPTVTCPASSSSTM